MGARRQGPTRRQCGVALDGLQRRGRDRRSGNLKPSKKKSTERIDGIVATVMALGRAMVRDTCEWDGVLKVI